MEPIITDIILSMALCGIRFAARACPVTRHKLVIHTCDVKLRVTYQNTAHKNMSNLKYAPNLFHNLYHLHMSLRDANKFKMLSCSLQQLIQWLQWLEHIVMNSKRIIRSTSMTTSAIKIGEVTFFFSAFGWTPSPPTLGSGSSFRHPLEAESGWLAIRKMSSRLIMLKWT